MAGAREEYDLVVIGSGPGGYVSAIRAAQLGMRTAVVEKGPTFGGTCLNVGCIPTKALLESAHLWRHLKRARELGVTVESPAFDFARIASRRDRVVKRLTMAVGNLLRQNKVDTFQGTGSLVGKGRVEVKGEKESVGLEAKYILLATGSVPRALPPIPFDGKKVISSDEAVAAREVPPSIAIIGAGAIGVEFATIYATFGCRVTLLELLPRVLPLEDEEVSAVLGESLGRQGISVHTSTMVSSVEPAGEGVRLRFKKEGGEEETAEAEKVLVATGRAPYTEGLGLEGTSVGVDRGFVQVDAKFQTGEKGIFAIGDILPTAQLAHVAWTEGIAAVEAMAGRDVAPVDYRRIPACTFSNPEVASIGLSEAAAEAAGFAVRVGRFPFQMNSKAAILPRAEGMVKVVSDKKTDEILGVHIIGPVATELISAAAVAMSHKATAESLARTVMAHPTLGESLVEAAHDLHGMAIHA